MKRRLAIAWTGLLALATARVMSATEITVAQLKNLRTEPRKIVYKTADNVKLQVHLYAAEGRAPGEKRPAILMIHGGGWESPGPFHMAPHCRYFALRGLVAVNVEYRLAKKDSAVRIPDCGNHEIGEESRAVFPHAPAAYVLQTPVGCSHLQILFGFAGRDVRG